MGLGHGVKLGARLEQGLGLGSSHKSSLVRKCRKIAAGQTAL